MITEAKERGRLGPGQRRTSSLVSPWALTLGSLAAGFLYWALVLSPESSKGVRIRISGVTKQHAEPVYVAVEDLKPMKPTLAVDLSNSSTSPLLEHLFVCITFHWDVQGLTLLRQALMTISEYPTTVTMCIISNRPELLRRAIRKWSNSAEDYVCGTDVALDDPHDLAFVHRSYMEQAYDYPERYSAFMYIEHDINVPWPALLGWAADTPVLEPLGFQRGLYRVETSEQTGLPGLTDQVFRVNITLYNLKLRVTLADEFAPYQERNFLQMPNPYFGMWVATRSQLAKFLRSEQWHQRTDPWLTRAMAACGLQFVDVPEGFFSAAVVPYEPTADPPALHPDSAVEHLSNRYCHANTQEGSSTNPADHKDDQQALHCTVSVQDFLYA